MIIIRKTLFANPSSASLQCTLVSTMSIPKTPDLAQRCPDHSIPPDAGLFLAGQGREVSRGCVGLGYYAGSDAGPAEGYPSSMGSPQQAAVAWADSLTPHFIFYSRAVYSASLRPECDSSMVGEPPLYEALLTLAINIMGVHRTTDTCILLVNSRFACENEQVYIGLSMRDISLKFMRPVPLTANTVESIV